MLKDCIAHGECFVDDQYLRRDGDSDGEREPHVHAARISLQRLIDEVANLSEARNLGKQSFCLRSRKTEQRSVHEDVLDAGELRVEAGAELE